MKRFYLLVAFLIANLSFGQTETLTGQAYLETTAKVDTLINPDIIYLDILISEKDERNRISVEEMEAQMIQKLKLLGVDTEKQLTLTDLGSNFKKYFLREKDIMKNKAYELKVFDTRTAGRILVGLEEIGISNVDLNRTEYSRIEELKLELKSEAVKKARKQANYLVKPLNQRITGAIHISDKFPENFNSRNARLQEIVVIEYSGKGKQEYTPPAIEFKPIKVESEVTVKFGIE